MTRPSHVGHVRPFFITHRSDPHLVSFAVLITSTQSSLLLLQHDPLFIFEIHTPISKMKATGTIALVLAAWATAAGASPAFLRKNTGHVDSVYEAGF